MHAIETSSKMDDFEKATAGFMKTVPIVYTLMNRFQETHNNLI